MCVMVHGALLYDLSARLVQHVGGDIRTRLVCSVDISIVNLGGKWHVRVVDVALVRLRHTSE